ncbi:MAG TPA: rod-binding protein [Polyangiaceae bacterium]|jgi:flagellar protein FlgJ|nr:rod-binding protein [Polyangiaceae bacterium]
MIPPISSTPAVNAGTASPALDPRIQKAARDFEAIFVRQMLKSVEKTTAAGGGTQAAAGENTYGSMIVGALSDAISNAGGLGLADEIQKSLARAVTKPSK